MPPKAPPPTLADAQLLRSAFNSCKDGAIGTFRGSEANAYRALVPLLSAQFLQGVSTVDGANQRVKRWFDKEKKRRVDSGEPQPSATDSAVQAQLWARAEAARPAFEARFAALCAGAKLAGSSAAPVKQPEPTKPKPPAPAPGPPKPPAPAPAPVPAPVHATKPVSADEQLLRSAFNSCKDGAIGALRGMEANAYRTLLPLLSTQYLRGVTTEKSANQRVKRWFDREKARRAATGEPLPSATDSAAQAQLWARAEAARPAFEARFAALCAEAKLAEGGAAPVKKPEPTKPKPPVPAPGPPKPPASTPVPAPAPKPKKDKQKAAANADANAAKKEPKLSFRPVEDPLLPPDAKAYECTYDRRAQLGFDRTRPRFFKLVVLNNSELHDVATNHPKAYGSFQRHAVPTFKAYVHEHYSTNEGVGRFAIGKFQAKGNVLASAKARLRTRGVYSSSTNVDRAGYMWLYDCMTILTPEIQGENMLSLEQELILSFMANGDDEQYCTRKCKNQRDDQAGVGACRDTPGYVYIVSGPKAGKSGAGTAQIASGGGGGAGGAGGSGSAGAKRERAEIAAPSSEPPAKKAAKAAGVSSAGGGDGAPAAPARKYGVPHAGGSLSAEEKMQHGGQFVCDFYKYTRADLVAAHKAVCDAAATPGSGTRLSWNAVAKELGITVKGRPNAVTKLPQVWAQMCQGKPSGILPRAPPLTPP